MISVTALCYSDGEFCINIENYNLTTMQMKVNSHIFVHFIHRSSYKDVWRFFLISSYNECMLFLLL